MNYYYRGIYQLRSEKVVSVVLFEPGEMDPYYDEETPSMDMTMWHNNTRVEISHPLQKDITGPLNWAII